MKKKSLALVAAMALLVVGVVSGSLAWLTDTTGDVKNTFTTSGIDITLAETWNTDTNNDGTKDAWQAKMVPGYVYSKDPKVTVLKNSEKCYLFVKVVEEGAPNDKDFDSYLDYSMVTEWNALYDSVDENGQLTGNKVPNVYYRVVDASATDQVFAVIQDNKVTVRSNLGNDEMDALGNNSLTLTVTAYASQYNKNQSETFTPYEAWQNVSPATETPEVDE